MSCDTWSNRTRAYVLWDAERGLARLLDLGSTNGTFVGTERLRQGDARVLFPGDRFHLARPEHGFTIQSEG